MTEVAGAKVRVQQQSFCSCGDAAIATLVGVQASWMAFMSSMVFDGSFVLTQIRPLLPIASSNGNFLPSDGRRGCLGDSRLYIIVSCCESVKVKVSVRYRVKIIEGGAPAPVPDSRSTLAQLEVPQKHPFLELAVPCRLASLWVEAFDFWLAERQSERDARVDDGSRLWGIK